MQTLDRILLKCVLLQSQRALHSRDKPESVVTHAAEAQEAGKVPQNQFRGDGKQWY